MRVSVILPVRNGGAYLETAVTSILRQSMHDFELLVIDDGSTDAAFAAVRPVAARDGRIRLLRNPGSGIVDALNFGLAESRCALIARMDADDIALPDRFARQVEFLDREPSVAVLGTQAAFIDPSGNLTGDRTHFPTDPGSIAAALLTRGCVLRHPTVLARRDVLLRAGGYRPAPAKAEDYDLWLRLSEHVRLANLPEVLLYYRVHSDQVSAGLNLQQRFGHDLSLLAARKRRSGLPDPLNGAVGELRFDRLGHWWNLMPPSLTSLANAYHSLAYFEGAPGAEPGREAVADLISNARMGFLGGGRRFRALSLMRCSRLALRRGDLRLAAAAAKLAIQIAPGRVARWVFAMHRL